MSHWKTNIMNNIICLDVQYFTIGSIFFRILNFQEKSQSLSTKYI